MLAKVVNGNAGLLDDRVGLEFFASKLAPTEAGPAPGGPCYQKRCWVRRLHQVSSTRSTEPLAARPTRSCRLLRSA